MGGRLVGVGGVDEEEEEVRGWVGEFLRSLGPIGSSYSRIMDLKAVFLGVCLCALAVTYSQAGIPKCCMSTKPNIPLRILAKVQRYEVQLSNGACDIAALVLHVKDFRRPICANLKVMSSLLRIQQRRRRSHHK